MYSRSISRSELRNILIRKYRDREIIFSSASLVFLTVFASLTSFPVVINSLVVLPIVISLIISFYLWYSMADFFPPKKKSYLSTDVIKWGLGIIGWLFGIIFTFIAVLTDSEIYEEDILLSLYLLITYAITSYIFVTSFIKNKKSVRLTFLLPLSLIIFSNTVMILGIESKKIYDLMISYLGEWIEILSAFLLISEIFFIINIIPILSLWLLIKQRITLNSICMPDKLDESLKPMINFENVAKNHKVGVRLKDEKTLFAVGEKFTILVNVKRASEVKNYRELIDDVNCYILNRWNNEDEKEKKINVDMFGENTLSLYYKKPEKSIKSEEIYKRICKIL